MVEPPEPNESLAPTLYLGMDGTGVPVRKKELVDRPGKQPDGSSKTREVKLVTIWSAEGRDKEGTPVETPARSATRLLSKVRRRKTRTRRRASSRRASSVNAARLRARGAPGRARRWGHLDLEPHRRALSRCGSDRRPLPRYLGRSKSIYGAGTDLAQQWASERHDELDAGDIDDILDALRLHRRRMTRRASASTTSNATKSACATRSSEQQGFVPRLGSLRPVQSSDRNPVQARRDALDRRWR